MTAPVEAAKTAALEWLDLLNRLRTRAWGDPFAGIVLETISLGDRRGQPWDISSLAAHLNINRATCSRWVDELVNRGLVERKRGGRHVWLSVTDRAHTIFTEVGGERWLIRFVATAEEISRLLNRSK